jgi:hypothetical protein
MLAAFTAVQILDLEPPFVAELKIAIEIQRRAGIVGAREVRFAGWHGYSSADLNLVFWLVRLSERGRTNSKNGNDDENISSDFMHLLGAFQFAGHVRAR